MNLLNYLRSTARYFVISVTIYLSTQSFLTGQNLDFSPGKVIDTVKCLKNLSQSYALYLPQQYDPDISWPIIYIFEPAARAKLATQIFSYGGENLGVIIVCSNNSRNGSWDLVFNSANAMFEDTFDRFNIDKDRVYTAGFSGGSRAAVTIAIMTNQIRGVIGCGAGFSANSQHMPRDQNDFDYVGIVGNADMNYQEHFKVRSTLNHLQLDNHLIHFDGPHQWPDKSIIYNAMAWHRYKEIVDSLLPKDEEFISKVYNINKVLADSLLAENQLVEAIRIYEEVIEHFEPFVSTEGIKLEMQEIKDTKEYKNQFKVFEKVQRKEKQFRELYISAFTELAITKLKADPSTFKGKSWWRNEIKRLNKIKSSTNPENSLMGKRLLNMIWANCAESIWNFASQNDFETASLLMDIWLMVQPESLWAWTTKVRFKALTNENQEAILALKAARKFGLTSFQFLEKDTNFQKLMQTPEFRNYVKEIQ